jgi:hypothetical protein
MALIGMVALVPSISGASSPTGLAPVPAQQLLADVTLAKPPELSGALEWTVNLGFSDLSSLEDEAGEGSSDGGAQASGFDPLDLLSNNYQVNVWLDGAHGEHLALVDGPAEEVDFVASGGQAWLWDSSTETATHLVALPGSGAGLGTAPGASGLGPAAGGTPIAGAPVTPGQFALALLGHLGQTTSLATGNPLYIAGEPAYQLLVAPKDADGSTVDHIEVDIGAAGPLLGVPLQVAVYAKGQSSPAIELGFTGVVHLGAPPTSELTFTPPPGAKVVTRTVGGNDEIEGHEGVSDLTETGTGWATVVSGLAPGLVASTSQGDISAAATPVNVAGQEGRLFSTVLLNVLVMPDGRFYAGLVTPSALEAAASAGS